MRRQLVGNGRRQKTGSQECQNLGAIVVPEGNSCPLAEHLHVPISPYCTHTSLESLCSHVPAYGEGSAGHHRQAKRADSAKGSCQPWNGLQATLHPAFGLGKLAVGPSALWSEGSGRGGVLRLGMLGGPRRRGLQTRRVSHRGGRTRSALDLERVLLHFSNVRLMKLKTVFSHASPLHF